jgi:hypothetical protein
MPRKGKLGNLVGVSEWETLETVGDAKRFLKWVIHSMRNQTLEPGQASIFAQIGGVLLKTVQASDFEARLERIEQALKAAGEVDDGESGKQTVTH